MNIPDNVAVVLKYAAIPAVFSVLYLGGLKDAPALIIWIVSIFFILLELSMVPFDLGQASADEVHSLAYAVSPAHIDHLRLFKTTRFYSKTGLSRAKWILKFISISFWLLFGFIIFVITGLGG